MASVCGRVRQALQSCAGKNAVVSKLCVTKTTSLGGGASKLPGFAASTTTPKSSFQFSSNRLPVELRCMQSLMPLHSATASALFTTLLSLPAQSWGSLSQGMKADFVIKLLTHKVRRQSFKTYDRLVKCE